MTTNDVLEWNTLVKGDEVTLLGEKGCIYTFLSAALNPDTGECVHVNLVGGRKGRITKKGDTRQRSMRAIRPERIKIPNEKQLEKQRRLRALKAEQLDAE